MNFNSGELDPRLGGRVDNDKYYSGLSVCENFVPIIQGALTRRAGSEFIGAHKSAAFARNVRFSYSIGINYVLEFGDGYIRFWRDRGLLLVAPNTPYEIASPFAAGDLALLRFVQSADVLYIASNGRLPIQKLIRLGDTNWTIGDAPFREGPLQDQNTDKTKSMWYEDAASDAGAPGNVVTLKSDFAFFVPAMVGQFIELELITRATASAWTANLGVGTSGGFDPGDIAFYDKNYYLALDASGDGHTGSTPPIHTEGDAWDGKDGVKWRYLHSGYGLVRITAVTDANTVTATVIDRLPLDVKDASFKTYRWSRSAYGYDIGWPTVVQFFRERLALAGNQRLDESVAQDFENYQKRDAGQITEDLALSVRIASGAVNEIRWLSPDSAGLIIGTRGQEFLQDEASQNIPFGSTNSRIRPMSQYGSGYATPVEFVGDTTVYILRSLKRVMGAVYDYSVDRVVSTNLSKFAEHITEVGIRDMAFQQNPYSIVWMVRNDGALVAMTYDREQQVVAFHRHPMLGAFVDSVAVIPSPDGATDDVWISVQRIIHGVPVRYMELISFQDADIEKSVSRFLDCSVWRNYPTKVSVVDGLEHLEGQTVTVLADGAAQAGKIVAGGQITLEYPAQNILVGLRMISRLRTMRVESGQPEGTSLGRKKRVSMAFIQFINSLGGKIGMDFDVLDVIPTRAGLSTNMDQAPPSVDGILEVPVPGTFTRDKCYVAYVQDQPFPTTIASITGILETNG